MDSPYKILGVKEGEELEVVKKAYIKQLKKYHPDVNKDKNAAKMTKKIIEAYKTIVKEKQNSRTDENFKKPKEAKADILNNKFISEIIKLSLIKEVNCDANLEEINEILFSIIMSGSDVSKQEEYEKSNVKTYRR